MTNQLTVGQPLSAYGSQVGSRAAAAVLLSLSICTGCKQLSSPTQKTTTATQAKTTVNLPDPRRYGGPANFVTNPSFEKVIAPWVSWNKNSVVRLSRVIHRDGRASARVMTTAAAPYGIQLAGAVGAPGRGDVFRLSTWMRSAARPQRVELILTAYGPRSSTQAVAQHEVIVGTRWRRATVIGRIRGANRDSLTATIVVLRSVGAGSAFFLDRVSLTSAPGR
jgi:hypothetical protein